VDPKRSLVQITSHLVTDFLIRKMIQIKNCVVALCDGLRVRNLTFAAIPSGDTKACTRAGSSHRPSEQQAGLTALGLRALAAINELEATAGEANIAVLLEISPV
jgi:hypothetical protein